MSPDQFSRERRYCAAVALAKSMLDRDVITHQEYEEIRRMFVQKYRPVIGGI